jgi:hydroxypyruvate reductase
VSGALELSDPETILAAVDTDGIDGNSDVAGGLVDHETAATIDTATSALDTHETTRALREADAAVETGPTGTNVNDLRIHLVDTATGHDSQ